MAVVSCRQTTAGRWQPVAVCSFADELAVFRLDVKVVSATLDWLKTYLTPVEQERAGRYHQPLDRLRFVGGRGLIRHIIGQYVQQPLNQIAIDIGHRNKPFLPNLPGLHINLAHAGDWILLAVGRKAVGIDLEYIDDQVDYPFIANTSFSPAEQDALADNPDPRRLFYALWTRKEALVKATGIGITDAFDQIPALPGEHTVSMSVLDDPGAWVVRGFAVNDRHPAALAHRPIATEPFFYTFSVDNSA